MSVLETDILESNERFIIDMMKENMLMEITMNQDYIKFLKEQVHIFKIELSHKNEQISRLIKIIDNNIKRVQMETMPGSNHHKIQNIENKECNNDIKLTEDYATEGNYETREDYVNDDRNDLSSNCSVEENKFEIDKKRITARRKKGNKGIKLHNNFSSLNYQCTENDDIQNNVVETDDGDHERNSSPHPSTIKAKRQSNIFTNKCPDNDVNDYSYKKTVPGNPEDSSVIKDGKSVCILSDSICKRIKINELNKYIKNKKGLQKMFRWCRYQSTTPLRYSYT